MRAKTINDLQNFEQGGNPYVKMNVGQTVLDNIYDDVYDWAFNYIDNYNPDLALLDLLSKRDLAQTVIEEKNIDYNYSNIVNKAIDAVFNDYLESKGLLNETQEFKQGTNPYTSLNIGISRLVKDAQVYWYPNKSSWIQLSKNDDKPKKSGQLTKQQWIVFPAINYRGMIRFAKTVNNDTVFVEDYKEATNGVIDWHRKQSEDPIDKKIAKQLTNWFLTHADEVMPKAIEADKTEYLDMVTI